MAESSVVVVRQLGLAAYLKSNGCNLLRIEDKSFYFSTDRSLKDWSIQYSNSCCAKHDTELCELRKLLNLGD
jgi:Domain of unknown function (DUF5659)